jgi:hypothetical protein
MLKASTSKHSMMQQRSTRLGAMMQKQIATRRLFFLPAALQECTQHEIECGGRRLVVRIVGLDVSLIRRQSHVAVRGSRQQCATPASSSRGSSRSSECEIGGGMGEGGCEVGQNWHKRASSNRNARGRRRLFKPWRQPVRLQWNPWRSQLFLYVI